MLFDLSFMCVLVWENGYGMERKRMEIDICIKARMVEEERVRTRARACMYCDYSLPIGLRACESV